MVESVVVVRCAKCQSAISGIHHHQQHSSPLTHNSSCSNEGYYRRWIMVVEQLSNALSPV